jgi:hypothetical protein
LFQVTSEFGPNPYRGFAVAFGVVLITKQFRGQTFRTSGAFCFLFEFGSITEGIGGVPFRMGEEYSSAGPDEGQFDKTRWSIVLGAMQSQAPCAQKALAELCGLYWRPLYAFARRRGRSPEDAQDLVQGFLGRDVDSYAPVTYEESADALGVGVSNVTSLIHRLRQRHAQLVREEVEHTVLDPAEVEAELHGLCEALVQAEGRMRA